MKRLAGLRRFIEKYGEIMGNYMFWELEGGTLEWVLG
jgi:hypothetical protein